MNTISGGVPCRVWSLPTVGWLQVHRPRVPEFLVSIVYCECCLTDSPTTSRRWFCLPSTSAHLTGLELGSSSQPKLPICLTKDIQLSRATRKCTLVSSLPASPHPTPDSPIAWRLPDTPHRSRASPWSSTSPANCRGIKVQLFEVSVPQRLFQGVLDRIGRLSPAPN